MYYYGQYVAVVLALTLEQARAAAEATQVNDTKTPHDTSEKLIGTEPSTPEKRAVAKRGDTVAGFAAALIKHDVVYKLAGEIHDLSSCTLRSRSTKMASSCSTRPRRA